MIVKLLIGIAIVAVGMGLVHTAVIYREADGSRSWMDVALFLFCSIYQATAGLVLFGIMIGAIQ